jgi:hypothetical protein
MKRLAVLAVVIGLVGLGSPRIARADQCEFVTQQQAEAARDVLRKAPTVADFCSPCGDKAPTKHPVKSLAIHNHDGFFQLAINGKEVDLAYTYYPVGDDSYRNLAMAAKCKVVEVPEQITVK